MDGVLWGVFNTPLPCYSKKNRVRGMPLGEICKTRRHAGILLPDMAPLICVRPIVMKIQRIITYLGSVLLVALSQINVSFSHTFC